MSAKRRKDSAFDKNEEIWIISQYHWGYSSIQVKRNFQKEFGEAMKNRKCKNAIFFCKKFDISAIAAAVTL